MDTMMLQEVRSGNLQRGSAQH